MNRIKWWLAGILTVIAVSASAKMVVNGFLVKAGFENLAADPVLNLFNGRMYYNTTSNTVKFYNGSSWGDVGSGLSVPTGTIAPQVGTTVPAGWLAADGSCQTTATYPALQAEIVTGAWDQTGCIAGEFRLPDLRNRYIRGSGTNGSGGGNVVALGAFQTDNNLQHNHTHDHPSTGTSGDTHTHRIGRVTGPSTQVWMGGMSSTSGISANISGGSSTTFQALRYESDSHSHSLNLANIGSSQSGNATEVTVNGYGVNFIIKI